MQSCTGAASNIRPARPKSGSIEQRGLVLLELRTVTQLWKSTVAILYSANLAGVWRMCAIPQVTSSPWNS